ncbi:MAG: hypothetical protein AB7I36_08230 [Rhodospirillaceae bacterium]
MARTDNALFLYYNLGDEATVTASSEITDAEAEFVQTMDPGEPWRADDKVEESLVWDHGSVVDITHAAAIWHNLDTSGSIQFEMSNTVSFSSLVYDSGELEAWDPVSGFGADSFGYSLGGYPVLTDRNAYVPFKLFDLGGIKSARYSRMTFRNPTNSLIAGIACGRAFVGRGEQFQYNIGFNLSTQWVDTSVITPTEASVRTKRGRSYRVMNMNLPNITRDEAIAAWDDIKRTIGCSRDIIVVPFPNGGAPLRYRTTIYGMPINPEPYALTNVRFYASAMQIRELAA